ncbi:MAG: GNAT family N-acetyltransferase [Deltaproteobacteria bacterium]|nr:GNAT family N-acetyltransferase [Deltaproteobacteria bacterium]
MTGGRLRARRLSPGDRSAALACLLTAPEQNLVLIDQVEQLAGGTHPGEPPPQVHGAFDGDRLVGLAALRPGIALSHGLDDACLSALRPALLRIPSGLLKSDRRTVELLWPLFLAAGREALIDRIELAYHRTAPLDETPTDGGPPVVAPPGVARPARAGDLEALVHAARASLWEEQRPDPAERDPVGFARWVESRLPRARVVCEGGRVVFVAYADVRSRHGWLVQGVYTWPDVRRRGYARQGMSALVREAFAAGASHVQLSVVAGNERASRLYGKLGFEPFAELRTVLFH